MQPLWAPWRVAYIEAPPPGECVFCTLPRAEGEAEERERLILGRSAHAFVMLNRFPYNPGHLLVIPRVHEGQFTALDPEVFADLHQLLRTSVQAVEEIYAPEGLNLGMNLGRMAGAGIADHLHYHVVPRWGGDTNFMPILGEAKSVGEHLERSWERLRPAFSRLLA